MKAVFLITGFLLLAAKGFSQAGTGNDTTCSILTEYSNRVALSSIGFTRITLKDGTAKKNCLIREIKANHIVYVKDRVLHDMAIERIYRIEMEEGNRAIYFNKQNVPMIKSLYNEQY